MRKRLVQALIFSGMVCLTAIVTDVGLTGFFRKETATKAGKIFALQGRHDDFVILGNSRVLNNADVDSIQTLTGLKGYNLGLDGSNLMQQYLILHTYFEKNHTRQVILNVDPWGVQLRLNKLQRIYPFVLRLQDDTIFAHLKKTFGAKVYIWKYLPMFKHSVFNSRLGILAALGIKTGSYAEPIGEAGDYTKVNPKILTPDKKYIPNRILIRPEAIQYFEFISALCKQHQAELKLYISPTYSEFYHRHQNIDSVMAAIEEKAQASLYNFCDSAICKQATNFYDRHHLNRTGRSRFTPMLARYIQPKP